MLAAYRPVKSLPPVCSRSGSFATSVGGYSGGDIPLGATRDTTTRLLRDCNNNFRHLETEVYGKLFYNDIDRDKYLLEHGYLTPYYSRPSCWYGLHLPRATRKYIIKTGNIDIIPVIVSALDKCNDYDLTYGAEPVCHGQRYKGK